MMTASDPVMGGQVRQHSYLLPMRHLITLALLATPSAAWEYTPGLPCLLNHEESGVAFELTYDPTQPLYSITITRANPWPPAQVFSMRFSGQNTIAISTDRHTLSNDGRSLTVIDRGFGNVLNGLQFNDTVEALLGEAYVAASLSGAEEPVAAFRLCQPQPGV